MKCLRAEAVPCGLERGRHFLSGAGLRRGDAGLIAPPGEAAHGWWSQGTCVAAECHPGSGEEAKTRNGRCSPEMLVRITKNTNINILTGAQTVWDIYIYI